VFQLCVLPTAANARLLVRYNDCCYGVEKNYLCLYQLKYNSGLVQTHGALVPGAVSKILRVVVSEFTNVKYFIRVMIG